MINSNFKLQPIFFISENTKNKERAINFLREDLSKYNKLAETSTSNQIELITSGVKIILDASYQDIQNNKNRLLVCQFRLNKTRDAVDCIDIFFPEITLSNKAIKLAVSVAKSYIQLQLIPYQDWKLDIKLQITSYFHNFAEKQTNKLHEQIKHELRLDQAKRLHVNQPIQVNA